MTKIITIGDKDVTFTCSSITPILYKSEFGTDFFADVLRLTQSFDGKKVTDYENIDFTIFSKIAWACAKTAKEKEKPFEKWLRDNPDFDLIQHGMQIMEIVSDSMRAKKK